MLISYLDIDTVKLIVILLHISYTKNMMMRFFATIVIRVETIQDDR